MSAVLDAIYLSPHLDDAALSCGGQIASRVRAGQQVRVVTVFAAQEPVVPPSDLVRGLHADFGLPPGGVVEARRVEDVAAMRVLGCEYEHWDFLEGIYREDRGGGHALYPSLPALFGNVSEAEDPEWLAMLRQRLCGLPPARMVAVPLGIGGQVDHAVLRSAVEACFDFTVRVYYEDYPYVERPLALWRCLGWRRGWHSRIEPVDAAALRAKQAAIGSYPSQVKPLFGSDIRMARRVASHAYRRGGERLWCRDACRVKR